MEEKDKDEQGLIPEKISESKAVVPVPPRGLKDQEAESVKEKALEIVNQVKESDSRQFVRKLSSIGSDAQQRTSAKMGLLKTRVGTLLKDLDGEGAKIPNDLLKLRNTMDSINPHKLSQPRGWLKKIPKIGKILAEISTKYESVGTQIDIIIASLHNGKDQLLRDSIELDDLYVGVKDEQLEVQKNAYLGELIIGRLEEVISTVSDATEKVRLKNVLHRVATRVQDLKTMEQVNLQFFTSIDMTIDNNDKLSDSISRTVIVGRNLLTIGLALQAALANQRRITKAVQATQEYMSEMLVANAKSVKQQTIEIGDLQNNPVLALDKTKEAFDELMGAMDEVDRIKSEGVKSAKEGIAQLTEMSSKLQTRTEGLHSSRDSHHQVEAGDDQKSIEA